MFSDRLGSAPKTPSEAQRKRVREEEEGQRSGTKFCGERKLDAETEQAKFDPTIRPVGQVVKTAASHAVNIGSNPVRVTTLKKAAFVRCFFEGGQIFAGLIAQIDVDIAAAKQYNMVCFRRTGCK